MARFTDMAYYDGKDLPRCKAKPTAADRQALADGANPEHATATVLVCALPAGHDKYTNRRHRSHSWAPDEG